MENVYNEIQYSTDESLNKGENLSNYNDDSNVDVILDVQNLRKVFKNGDVELEVLKNINLKVKRGDFISLMGESGSGKSTLLYQIGCLDEPTSGKVLIDGIDVSKISDEKKAVLRREKLGFVFQFYNLIANLNVRDNILLPVIMDGKNPKDYEDKLNEILEIVGLSDKRYFFPRQLSGGQQQRVSIARAIIMSPDLLLADEPTGNLDSVSTNEIMNLFKKLNLEKNITIIQVTHSKETALFSKKIINLKDGVIIN